MTRLYWQLISGGVALLVLAALVASWWARGQENDRLKHWQDTVVLSVTQATVQADKNGGRRAVTPEAVPAAIAALKTSKDNAEAALMAIDTGARADQAAGARLDNGLKQTLDRQDRAAAATRAQIAKLAQRTSTGDRDKDCGLIENDSKAPWRDWSN